MLVLDSTLVLNSTLVFDSTLVLDSTLVFDSTLVLDSTLVFDAAQLPPLTLVCTIAACTGAIAGFCVAVPAVHCIWPSSQPARQGFLPTKRHILQSRTGSTCSSMQMLNLRVRVGLCVILSLLWASKVYGEVLAAGKLEKCVRDGVTEVVQCSDKLVITVTVANGQTLKTEELDLTVLCVNSPTGECPCPCNAAVDEDCSCRDLAAPMKVTITKSLLWASYPLTFVQQFNWKPVEIIQYTNSKKCRDGDYEQYPTCPYYYDGKDKVPDSQGFCCQCSSGEVWDDTFGDLKYRTRANLNCDFRLGMLIGIYPAAAHCVQLDRFNFAVSTRVGLGYNVGPPSLNFEIYVNIEIPTIPAGWSPRVNGTSSVSVNATTLSNGTLNTSQNTFVMRYETLTLSPSIPLAVSKTKMVSVKLLGDLAMYTMLPTFGHQMLMLPLYDIGNRSTWMLVDKSLISLDGRTCDKIGTSFSAFRYQPSGCHRAVSTCLKGQLKDLYDEDMDRIKKGRAPLYMVSQYPGYEQASFTAGKFGNETVFLLPVTSQSQSVLTLTVSADKLRLITNRSPGKISDVQLCRFGNASHCGFFEAGNRGYIRLNVTNTGRLDADYTVAVTNCSSNIRPIEARMIAVSAGRTAPLWPPIEVYVEDTENKTRSCSVLLYDSTGGIADQTEMSFSTNQTDFGPTPTGGFNGTGDSLARLEKDLTCDEACTNPINVWCIVVKRCWSKLFRLFGFMGGLFGGLGLLALAIKYGWLAALFGMCCNRAGSGDGGGANGWFNKSGDGVNTDNGGGTQMGNNKQPMPPMHQNNVYYGDGKQRPSSAQSLYNPNDPSKRMSNTNSIRYDARSGGRLQDTMGGLRATQRTEASRQSWFNPAAWAMRPSSRAGSLTGSVANGRATGLSVPGGSQRASMDGSRSSQWLQMPHRSWLSPSTWGGAARPSSRAGSITGSVANGFKPPGTEDGPRPSHQSSRSTWLNLATWASSVLTINLAKPGHMGILGIYYDPQSGSRMGGIPGSPWPTQSLIPWTGGTKSRQSWFNPAAWGMWLSSRAMSKARRAATADATSVLVRSSYVGPRSSQEDAVAQQHWFGRRGRLRSRRQQDSGAKPGKQAAPMCGSADHDQLLLSDSSWTRPRAQHHNIVTVGETLSHRDLADTTKETLAVTRIREIRDLPPKAPLPRRKRVNLRYCYR
ncbi:hypothetical protein VOLCADRAFT_105708 [Volvox carteri f. nagariensis]|uniref:Generative cell specific-1/HAP2 domain-containing protein n=1 Tax=Volvox carteri f. nagariensis TaxID=3068 RepID=D8U2H4_VOLCA|nr:uncharacterized protein VOLCADRAFT_105708 [Volvox carteri f. nagariensis]EFJ46134.1 hypothetical protein VOLCADRAFT_105708 [Volvox carteri f. nagariensis]|eukprot:XP_002952884.1 hypothetical protein VOLCADRAFT_105708 [Volvox carteri f. nagariensis]